MPCDTIAASVPNSGSHVWTAELCDSETDNYKVRVTDIESGAADECNDTFVITPPPECEVTILHPDEEESFCEGENVEILWSTSGQCGDRVRIEMLDRSGASIFGAIDQKLRRYEPSV